MVFNPPTSADQHGNVQAPPWLQPARDPILRYGREYHSPALPCFVWGWMKDHTRDWRGDLAGRASNDSQRFTSTDALGRDRSPQHNAPLPVCLPSPWLRGRRTARLTPDIPRTKAPPWYRRVAIASVTAPHPPLSSDDTALRRAPRRSRSQTVSCSPRHVSGAAATSYGGRHAATRWATARAVRPRRGRASAASGTPPR